MIRLVRRKPSDKGVVFVVEAFEQTACESCDLRGSLKFQLEPHEGKVPAESSIARTPL